MAGLLYPAYQKFYSALSCLERFEKEQNFFDNISSLDNFFAELLLLRFKQRLNTQNIFRLMKNIVINISRIIGLLRSKMKQLNRSHFS